MLRDLYRPQLLTEFYFIWFQSSPTSQPVTWFRKLLRAFSVLCDIACRLSQKSFLQEIYQQK